MRSSIVNDNDDSMDDMADGMDFKRRRANGLSDEDEENGDDDF